MDFEYKGNKYSFPSHLSEITLGQRVSFFRTHGKELEEQAKRVEAIKDDTERGDELLLLDMDLAVREFSHYTGIPLVELKNNIDFESMWQIYSVDVAHLREQEAKLELQESYEWEGETWVIESPEIEADSKMTLNEFLHAKEIVRHMTKLGNGKWDSMPYLCAVYLRKEGEPFTEELVKEGGERLKLMEQLPLDIAIAVGFFLSGTLSIYQSTSASLQRETERESTPPSTSIRGDG